MKWFLNLPILGLLFFSLSVAGGEPHHICKRTFGVVDIAKTGHPFFFEVSPELTSSLLTKLTHTLDPFGVLFINTLRQSLLNPTRSSLEQFSKDLDAGDPSGFDHIERSYINGLLECNRILRKMQNGPGAYSLTSDAIRRVKGMMSLLASSSPDDIFPVRRITSSHDREYNLFLLIAANAQQLSNSGVETELAIKEAFNAISFSFSSNLSKAQQLSEFESLLADLLLKELDPYSRLLNKDSKEVERYFDPTPEQIKAMTESEVVRKGDHQYAMIELKSFDPGATESVREKLQILLKTPDLKGVILDLRKNPGGFLNEALDLFTLFSDEVPKAILSRRPEDKEEVSHNPQDTLWNGPLGILVSTSTASAAEIFTGLMKDHGRGLVMGSSTTYGKGSYYGDYTVKIENSPNDQMVVLRLTRGFVRTEANRFHNGTGVAADVVFDSFIGQREFDHPKALRTPEAPDLSKIPPPVARELTFRSRQRMFEVYDNTSPRALQEEAVNVLNDYATKFWRD